MGIAVSHIAWAVFKGRAKLECADLCQIVPGLSVRFDPRTLEFEVHLPAAHGLVEVLAHERQPLEMCLHDIDLLSEDGQYHLTADAIGGLTRQNPLIEWPEACVFPERVHCESSQDTRRLVLAPQEQPLTFRMPTILSSEHPFQVHYGQACPGLWLPNGIRVEKLGASIHLTHDHPIPGVVCAFGAANFFDDGIEARLSAALSLGYGRLLLPVMTLQNQSICFYGSMNERKHQYLPMASEVHVFRELMDALLKGMLELPDAEFGSMQLALRFMLLGKDAPMPVEVLYLQLMTCIEAMDGVRTLQPKATSELLGVSMETACLLNAMRHQLVHGCGGYRQAFQRVAQEQFANCAEGLIGALRACIPIPAESPHRTWQAALKGRTPSPIEQQVLEMEEALEQVDFNPGQCNFAVLWLRLCERLDAYWCARLRVPEALAAKRYSQLPLQPLPVLCGKGGVDTTQ